MLVRDYAASADVMLELVKDEQYRFIIEFLLRPIAQPK